MAEYGFTDAFLKANPSVKTAVDKAIAGDFEMDKFLDLLKTTIWWKTKTDAQRRYDVMLVDNPAELRESVNTMLGNVTRMATQMGILGLSLARRRALATQAVQQGMTDAEVRFLIGSQNFGARPGYTNTGVIATSQAQLREIAKNYAIPMSRSFEVAAVRRVLQGVASPSDWEAHFREMAKKKFAAVADQLDAGLTVREIMDPYLAVAAQELGRNPNTIDISDSLWNRALTYREGTAPAREMDMDEWTRTIRTDARYGWDKGEVAQKSAAQFTQGLAQMFGAIGG